MSGRRWWRRAAGAVLAFAAAEVVLVLAHTGPDPLRLALLVVACVSVLGLVLDALPDTGPSWSVEIEAAPERRGGDPRLGRYVNLLEAHLTARTDDAALRERLGVLADQVLRQRHGLDRTDPRATELMGPDLSAVVDGPVRRLRLADVDRCLTRIEEL